MNTPLKYAATDRMSDLICENYSLLLVMSRFGLSLGFGDKTVGEVCEQNGVDTDTFLAVVHFLVEEQFLTEKFVGKLSVEALIHYLQQAHTYFLEFSLPAIRRKLIDAIDCSGNDVAFLILKFYDEYVNEVRKHMEYEDKVVFQYVFTLLHGGHATNYNIGAFVKKHNQIEVKLRELKNIIVKYYPEKVNNNLLNSVLFDIYSCESDLNAHCRVEDYMFVPLIQELEKRKTRQDE